MRLFADLETVPTQLDWARSDIAAAIKPPATLKKPESIAAWEATEREQAIAEAIDRTVFDGGLGQIVCISWAIDDDEPQSLQVGDLTPAEEARILREWFVALRRSYAGTSGIRPQIVGHNVIAFDLPFMMKRCIVHGIRPPMWWPRDPKPWGETVFDTMTQWAGARERISLDRLCKILGIAGKGDGPTGADVWPMVQAGRIDEVAAYCRADVSRTRACYRKMMFEEA